VLAADPTNTTSAPTHHRTRSNASNPRLEISLRVANPIANTTNIGMLEEEVDSRLAKPPAGLPDAITINRSGRPHPTPPTSDQVMIRSAMFPARGFARTNRPAAISAIKRPRPYQTNHSVTPEATTTGLDAKALVPRRGNAQFDRCLLRSSVGPRERDSGDDGASD